MKTLVVSLVAFLFALIIGCQESSITDPVSNDTEFNRNTTVPNSADKDFTSYYPGVINLEGKLFDPSHPFDKSAMIYGVVRYGLDSNPSGVEQRPPFAAIKVRLFINAELKGGCTGQGHPWTVNSRSEDIVYITGINQSIYNLEKSFRVRNTCCAHLNLILKFKVEEKTLKLVSMSLKLGGYK